MKKLLPWLNNNLLQLLIGFLIFFIPAWPKIPLVGISHTWTYIRLEDIFIAATFFWWLICLLRKKYSLKTPLTIPIIAYWVAGGASLIFTLLFTAPHLANFFPVVAMFHFLRRIEYLVVFIIAFNSVKSLNDLKRYLYILIFTVLFIVFYGFGQKLLGFPAYLTMNEEFAKGIALHLSPLSRLTSTFGGHYDLAAYLVIVISLFTGVIFGIKNVFGKIGLFLVNFIALILLLFTASRVSFVVYLIAVSFALWWSKKKYLIIPVVIASILLMSFVSGASERFLKTIRVREVVYDADTGKPIGAYENLPKKTVKKEDKIFIPINTDTQENLPLGSGSIGLPLDNSNPQATNVAYIRKPVPQTLKYSTVSAEIATISGSFLIQKALVYDISFTTRIQGEWPIAIKAFLTNPLFGTGYSSIGLSNDNDYLRALAETGLAGFASFMAILLIGGIFIKNALASEKNPFIKSLGIGLSASFTGLLINAVFIDVFEASKVALSIWILSGIILGGLALNFKNKINYKREIINFFTSHIFILISFAIVIALVLKGSISTYFIGDDFRWLKWSATSTYQDILLFFSEANGFFYRPLARTLYLFLYNIFWLQPQGYHLAGLALHIVNSSLAYLIIKKQTGKKLISFLLGILFLLLSIHGESLFWTSASFEMIAPLFALLSFYFYISNKKAYSAISFFLALLGHEGMIIFPLIIFAFDYFYSKKIEKKVYLLLGIFTTLYLEIRYYAGSHWFNGDYSFNLLKLPQNFFGNLISYLTGIFIGSFNLELSWIMLLLAAIIIGCLAIFLKRKKIINNPPIYFAASAFVISLLPYLGLGNTAPRYAYFASFWILLLLAFIFNQIKLSRLNKNVINILGMAIFILAVCWNLKELKREEQDWIRAGNITYKTLALLRQNYLPLPKNSIFYVANIPSRLGRAWIFPVGLEDGLWHIFRDETLSVIRVNNVEEALTLQKTSPEAHIFVFENYEIKEVK